MSNNHFRKLDINGLYGDLQPIMPSYEVVKKELSGNDYLKLYGALTLLAQNNMEYLHDYYCQSLNDIIESASIQDDELYLFNFEGYELNERYILRSLYLTDDAIKKLELLKKINGFDNSKVIEILLKKQKKLNLI